VLSHRTEPAETSGPVPVAHTPTAPPCLAPRGRHNRRTADLGAPDATAVRRLCGCLARRAPDGVYAGAKSEARTPAASWQHPTDEGLALHSLMLDAPVLDPRPLNSEETTNHEEEARALSSLLAAMTLVVAGSLAFANQAAAPGGVPGPPAWSHKGGLPGCGTAEVLVPQQSAEYYAEHPEAFVSDPDMPPDIAAQLEQIALNRPTVVTSVSCAPGLAHKPPKQGKVANTGMLNWAGYGTSTSTTATYVLMAWTEPTVVKSSVSAQMSIWPGLGSGKTASDELVQAGTGQSTGPACTVPYFWYELVPYENEVKVGGISVAAGDKVMVVVSFAPGTKTATFDFYNNTKNTYLRMTQKLPSGHAFKGNQVEWIVERPQLSNGSYTALPNFRSVSVTSARYHTSTTSTVSAPILTSTSYFMLNAAGQSLASPSGLTTNGAFTVTWVRSS